jgi:ferrous-iron efflux pump FieF
MVEDIAPRAPLAPEKAGRLMRAATYASVSVAASLALAKLGAWLATGSVSMLSTLVDSLLDAGAALVNFIAVRHALQPADRQHRFGHGKAESLAGLAQAAFVGGSGVFVSVQAIDRLLYPRPLSNPEIGYVVMLLAMAVSLALVVFQRYVVRKTGSLAIGAESLNYQNDILVNGAVILSLLLSSYFGWHIADPLFAIAIAGYIIWGAWRIFLAALDVLMDRELPDSDRAQIRELARACPNVLGLHDIRTRAAGPRVFIQLHLELDGSLSLDEAHAIVVSVEDAVKAAYPNAEVLIHADPDTVVEGHDRLA